MGLDDKKDAVNIGVTLSSQIISAALAMIAVTAALAVFVLDKESINYFILSIIIGAFMCFIASIFLGGRGIDVIRNEGYNGNWSLHETKCIFNWQAITSLMGIVLFIVASVSSAVCSNQEVKNYQKEISALKKSDTLKNQKVNKLESDIIEFKKKDSLNVSQIHKLLLEKDSISNSIKVRQTVNRKKK